MFDRFKKIDFGVRRTRQAWFGKISNLFSRADIDEELWEELEELLIGADMGVSTTENVMQELRDRVRREGLRQPEQARTALEQLLADMLHRSETDSRPEPLGIPGLAGPGPGASLPFSVILMVGVNGTGKTTTIAKLAKLLKEKKRRVVLAAGDTFRAAAIDQLKVWGERTQIDVVAHQPGADAAAVVYDALQAATGRKADVLIVDTAGRLHTKFNLMEELKKIRRVIERADPTAPHEVLLVIDATTGQNGLLQAEHFAEAVGVTGVVLTKLDGTAKGGIVFAIVDQLGIPIKFVGTGESMDDLAEFDPEEFVRALFAA